MAAKQTKKRLFERVFRKKWKDFTTNQILLAIGLIIAVATAAIKLAGWLWPSSPEATKQVMIDANAATATADSNSAAQAVDGDDNIVVGAHGIYVEAPQIDVEPLVTKAMEASRIQGHLEERLSQSEREKEELRRQLAEALRRVAVLQARGDDAEAADALREVRESGDTAKLLALLVRERERHRDERVKLNREIAAVAFLRGEIERAQQAVNDVLVAEPNDLSALIERGNIHYLQSRLAEAECDYRRTLELANDDVARAVALTSLGLVYRARGDLAQAEQMHRKALAINEMLGRRQGMANAYVNLGIVYQARGDLEQAERMHRKALALNEELGRREGMAAAYGNLGIVYQKWGDLDRADQMHHKALAIHARLGWRAGMADVCANLGNVRRARGDLGQAEQMYWKALAINEELGRRGDMAGLYGNLGVVYRTRGDLGQAEEMYRKGLAIDEKLGRREGMASAYGNLGNLYRVQGDLAQAEQMQRKALAMYEELGRREGMANVYANLGRLCQVRGDQEQAREYWGKAVGLYEQIGMAHMVEKVQGWLAGLDGKE